MTTWLDETQVDIMTVDNVREPGCEYVHWPQIAPDAETPERADYGRVVLPPRGL